jgi:intergrase/recombinase
MGINRIFPKSIPSFDPLDVSEFIKHGSVTEIPDSIDPKLWSQRATISENTAEKFVAKLIKHDTEKSHFGVGKMILAYYQLYIGDKNNTNPFNKAFAQLSDYLFQGDKDELKNQSSLLALKLLAGRGVIISKEELIKALTKIEL